MAKGKALQEAPEIEVRYIPNGIPTVQVTDSGVAYNFIKQLYKNGELNVQEQILILYLNRSNKVIGYYKHTKGTITMTPIDIRLILAVGLKCLCVSMIMAHNHPSGSTKPSKNDIHITERLKESAMLMDISLLDHLIVSEKGYYSMSDGGDVPGLQIRSDEASYLLEELTKLDFTNGK